LIGGERFECGDGLFATPSSWNGEALASRSCRGEFIHSSEKFIAAENVRTEFESEKLPVPLDYKFDLGRLPDDAPFTDFIFQGNIVQSIAAPRHKYAVVIACGPNAPRGLYFSNNLLHPGTAGVSNKELQHSLSAVLFRINDTHWN
jgi:hypothetical protein